MRLRVVLGVVVSGIVLAATPWSASAAPAGASAACTPTRSSLLDEAAATLDRVATLQESLTTEQYQLGVAQQYGDTSTARRLRTEIDAEQPEFDLRKAHSREIKTDLKGLQKCTAGSIRLATSHSRARSYELLRLYYVADASDQRKAANDAEYRLGIDEQYRDKERASVDRAKLSASKALLAEDKRKIKAIEARIRELRGK